MMAGPGGYLYSVMPIYQPAVGLQTENEVINNDAKFPISLELSKIITQWWATDIISDEQYSNAIGYLVDSNSISSPDAAEIILTDGPLDDVVTWKQMMEEIIPTYWAHEQKSDDDSMPYLSKIPSTMISNDKKNFGLPEWFKETAEWWGQDMITDKEFNKNIEYLVKKGIIESHSSSVFQNLVVESESIPASPSIQSPSIEQNTNESLSQDPVSEEPSDTPIESVTEIEINIPVELEGIHELVEFVNSIPDIDNRILKNLEPVVIYFDDGNINDACNNLENFFIILEYLINTNKIEQSLGQSLIAEGEIIKLDLCN